MADDGLRRRHSAQFDNGTPSRPRGRAENAARLRTGPGSAIDVHARDEDETDMGVPLQPTRSRSYDHTPHVRFSTEIEELQPRRPQPRVSTMPASASVDNQPSMSPASRILSDRPGTPSLSINTHLAEASTARHEDMIKSPRSLKSPESLTSPLSASRLSPGSARSRDRGYSLRRSIFNRNIHDQADGSPGSTIELEESNQPSSSHFAQPVPANQGKKSSESHITVREVKDLESSAADPWKLKWDGRVPTLPNYESWIQARASRSKFAKRWKQEYQRARKFILRINEIPPSKDGRHVDVDPARKAPLMDERTQKPYIDNTIRSSRYTVWNFLPRQLVAQFSKLANSYFLFVSVLQMIPGLSTTGTYTTIVPLAFFVTISIAKEGYDDLRRYRLDKEENNRGTLVFRAYQPTGGEIPDTPTLGPKVWASVKWKDVRVGDIIKLDRDDTAPADIVLLHSKGENDVAYIETMALDGETNLKSKQPSPPLIGSCDTLEKIAACNAKVTVEDPNLDLYNFEGKVTLNGETAPLTTGEVIYRGSVLRNTAEAFGLVIYSGEECKMRMNASKNPRIKAPTLQSVVNKIVIAMVFFVIFLAVFNTVAYEIWSANIEDQLWYLSSAEVAFFPVLVSFIVMFNTMIPLSLYVSLEIVKVFQRLLLNDLDMYDELSDTPMESRTSTINEELGQISYIFSDKTGTLTDNCMKFRKLSVAGTAWLHDSDLKMDAAKDTYRQRLQQQRRNKGKGPAHKHSRPSLRSSGSSAFLKSTGERPPLPTNSVVPTTWKSSARPTKAQYELQTMEMLHYIQRKPFTVFARKARFLLLSMALCHTCLPETKDDGSTAYQAASPDELALVQAAQEMGYMMADRRSGTLTIKTFPRGPDAEAQIEKYEVLDIIEFSSKRKRMSVVVRFPDNRICVVSKGADSVIMQLLRLSTLAAQKAAEIERKTSMRKSMEAREAIARKSEHRDSWDAIGRPSITLGRKSQSGLGRSSVGSSHAQPLHARVSTWLAEREHDVDASAMDDAAAYSSRPSVQLDRRSRASAEALRSPSLADEDFELVEEALAVDENAIIERCFQHINDFATEGLRTLMYGYRFLGEEEYNTWKKVYQDATTSLVDRQDMIERAGELIEHGFELAGATAIEDKLQKGVPETIDKLRRANIKLWMLTGDKRETAINIGHSCRLIKDYSTVVVLDQEYGDLEQVIASTIVSIGRDEIAHSVVVVDGQTLSTIESSQTLKSLFVDLAPIADSVICCRASPSQKALLVHTIRRKVKKSITLAIGDGANDIAMIQEAHVGIGITGKEGLQAARTSDYSIAQFRFLSKLLLVHGRWNYIRTCKYTLATFWKEMMFYLTQAMFQRWAGYTGTSLYESWSLTTFNTLFTSLPVIILGIFEKDLRPATLLAVPELYTKGQRNGGFNFKVYAWWIFMAVSESMLIYFLMFKLFASGGSFNVPANDNIFPMGDMTFTAVVITVSAKLQLLEMHDISYANAFAVFLSVGGWFLWNIIISSIYSNNTIYKVKYGFLEEFGQDLSWWATLLCILVAIAVFELSVRVIKATVRPTDTDIFQALEKDPAMMNRFENAARLELNGDMSSGTGEKRPSVAARKAAEEQAQAQTQAEREGEIAELLRNRIGANEAPKPKTPQQAGETPSTQTVKGGADATSKSAPPSVLEI